MLFLEQTLERKIDLINRFVDLDILNVLFSRDPNWVHFYRNYIDNGKIFNRELLILFINTFVNIFDPTIVYTVFDSSGNAQYLSPNEYSIDSLFKDCLVLNMFT